MADKMFLFANSWSYLPDVVGATIKLITNNHSGIFNAVGAENMSIFYVLKSVLNVPLFKDIDETKDINPYFTNEIDRFVIHNDVNCTKLSEIYTAMPLEAAFIVSWVTIADHFNANFDTTKYLHTSEDVI